MKIQRISFTKISWLRLFKRKTRRFFWKMRELQVHCGQNAHLLDIKVDSTYDYRWVLKD
jgi:hypothetical protein